MWPHRAVTLILRMVETERLLRIAGHNLTPGSVRGFVSKESEIEGDKAGHPASSFGLCKCTHKLVHVHTHHTQK